MVGKKYKILIPIYFDRKKDRFTKMLPVDSRISIVAILGDQVQIEYFDYFDCDRSVMKRKYGINGSITHIPVNSFILAVGGL